MLQPPEVPFLEGCSCQMTLTYMANGILGAGFCLFLISRREKLLRIKQRKFDHIDLALVLQDGLLGLLEQVSVSPWVCVYGWETLTEGKQHAGRCKDFGKFPQVQCCSQGSCILPGRTLFPRGAQSWGGRTEQLSPH